MQGCKSLLGALESEIGDSIRVSPCRIKGFFDLRGDSLSKSLSNYLKLCLVCDLKRDVVKLCVNVIGEVRSTKFRWKDER